MAKKIAYLCLLVSFLSIQFGETAQCMPDKDYPCRAKCNGTSFDLSKVFDFPLNISEPSPRSDGRLYSYVWDPCHSYACPGYPAAGTDCAVCQLANLFYNCGQTSEPIWLMDAYDNTKEEFPNWQVQYTFGTTWRVTIFNFIVDHTVKEPTVKFVSEEPGLQYNFEVRGKCIGQDTFDCQKYYSSRK
ncbi:uncharacterized protein LOC135343774 [Halichondria panicea]|uniref:uncharacterized protein LOC135343774 n=1 Tax=Halichondria panicea TaxID=6063 RepID=UPI00312B6E91